MKSLVILAASILAPATLAMADCRCAESPTSETTHYGGNMSVIIVEKTPRSIVAGMVKNSAGPVAGALVELFDHGEYLTQDKSRESEQRPKQVRIAVCKTGPDGKFCFPHLPAGNYEIRSSFDLGWDVTSVSVVVDPQKGKRKPLRIDMVIGT